MVDCILCPHIYDISALISLLHILPIYNATACCLRVAGFQGVGGTRNRLMRYGLPITYICFRGPRYFSATGSVLYCFDLILIIDTLIGDVFFGWQICGDQTIPGMIHSI
jgi:hypothetical protein